jgi:hypothetical protein
MACFCVSQYVFGICHVVVPSFLLLVLLFLVRWSYGLTEIMEHWIANRLQDAAVPNTWVGLACG